MTKHPDHDRPPSRRHFTITRLRDEKGVWRARITASDGTAVDGDRRWGSWQADVRVAKGSRTFRRHEVRRDVAAALQERVRRIERRQRRSRSTNHPTNPSDS